MRDRIKSLRRVAAKDLLPNPRNWRTHPPEQVDAMRGLLNEIGWADAVLAREDADGKLILIDGHLRKDVAPDAEVPVLILDVDEAEADKILATHDPIAAMATADEQRLGELLHDMSVEDEAVQTMLDDLAAEHDIDLGDEEPAEDPGAEIDKAAELQEKWGTKTGQVWIVKGKQEHRVVCGDATDGDTIARVFDGAEADIILTDPPYCSGGFQESGRVVGSVGSDAVSRKGLTVTRDNLTTAGLVSLIEKAIGRLPAVGCCYVFCDWRQFGEIRRAVEPLGFQYRAMLVWDKESPGMGGPWRHQFELVYFGTRRKEPATGNSGDVLRCTRSGNENHTTEKPLELLTTILDNTAGEVVADPFLGSGTTLVACEQLGRRGYGIEIEPKYVAVTLERMSQMGCECRLE